MKEVLKVLKYWLPTVVWAVIIFSFSAGKVPSASPVYWQDFVAKKIAHMLEYGVFAILLYRSLKFSGFDRIQAGTLTIIIAALYGASDEIHQMFTQGRESTVRDVVFDTIGATVGIYIVWKLLPKLPVKLRSLAASLDLL